MSCSVRTLFFAAYRDLVGASELTVEVKDGATIGAGSTITRDAPAGELTLSRAPQETRKGWQRPVKKKP